MARSVTVREIAQRAEVSIATVSRVLNNHEHINEQVKQRVLEAAAQLGYFKSIGKSASRDAMLSGAERQLKEIGYLFCYSDLGTPEIDPFWAPILYGAEAEAHKKKMRLIYQSIARHQSVYSLQTRLHEMRTDGILLVGPSEEETIRAIQAMHIPLVLIDNYASQVDSVLADNYEGARSAVKYLISQGHRQIAYIGGHTHVSPINDIYTFSWRKEGYCAALREADLPVNPDLIQECNLWLPDEIYASCKRLLDIQEPVSAIFCVNDPVASRTIKGLREYGLRVPEDISIMGLDDIMLSAHLRPPLTSVAVPKLHLARESIDLLFRQIDGDKDAPARKLIEPYLVVRQSTAFPVSE